MREVLQLELEDFVAGVPRDLAIPLIYRDPLLGQSEVRDPNRSLLERREKKVTRPPERYRVFRRPAGNGRRWSKCHRLEQRRCLAHALMSHCCDSQDRLFEVLELFQFVELPERRDSPRGNSDDGESNDPANDHGPHRSQHSGGNARLERSDLVRRSYKDLIDR
jgi:hypothetical protein